NAAGARPGLHEQSTTIAPPGATGRPAGSGSRRYTALPVSTAASAAAWKAPLTSSAGAHGPTSTGPSGIRPSGSRQASGSPGPAGTAASGPPLRKRLSTRPKRKLGPTGSEPYGRRRPARRRPATTASPIRTAAETAGSQTITAATPGAAGGGKRPGTRRGT